MIRIRAAEPSGKAVGFGDAFDAEGNQTFGGLVDIPTYPSSPNGDRLREVRIYLKLTLRTAAEKLGLSVVQFSGLETGSMLTDDWDAVWTGLGVATDFHPPPREITPLELCWDV